MFSRTPPDLDDASVSLAGLGGALKIMLVVLGAVASFIFVLVVVSRWLRLDFDAVFWTGGGAFLLAMTLIRPWWFWHHPKALFVRSILTDTGAIILYVLLTGSMIVTGVRRQMAINRARRECEVAVAKANDVHDRVRVLYEQGARNLPQSDREPRSLTCERLLE